MLESLRELPNMICARGWRRLWIAVPTGCRRDQAKGPLGFPGNRLPELAELACGVAIGAAGAIGDAEPEPALPALSKPPCRSHRCLAIRALGGPCPKAKVAPCIAHQAGYTAFTHEF
jgi:hypothetical protein